MSEAPYDSEDVLQELLAKFPGLLAGDQFTGSEPRRWLLIDREVAVPDSEDARGRWSVDHLFLDQDAVPTLVEVKRSSDTRIRREIVGQLIDYAANAVVYWPIEALRASFESRLERDGGDADLELPAVVGPRADAEGYWQQAAANLKAGRIRLVFVADEIPRELRRVVEFLNEQMAAEVIAIEVKQYVGPEGLRTLVARVVGQTAAAEMRKDSRDKPRWDEESLLRELEATHGPSEANVLRELIEWARVHRLRPWWGTGKGGFGPVLDHAGQTYYPFGVSSLGKVDIGFQYMTRPPLDDVQMRHEYRRRLNKIPGVSIPERAITRRPRFPLALLAADPKALEAFTSALDWFCDTVRSHPEDHAEEVAGI